ncbi:peptide/nickel transport system ATP-binding protein [Stella humosa]|uniref:Glutathione import ATP-binding protein GsiA n=1 Tax=Stella humosa TaxID=94 RepID=A0A3N1L5A5_9PROT|nr:ABC transporter ATP-binding protein [Stella humosa]ROP84575.1 peptide/nickel transport system ATP-binding protein [Stella humosa]BBK34095.1 peptide ABC transporter ATP-binding protein [Stella humosa]
MSTTPMRPILEVDGLRKHFPIAGGFGSGPRKAVRAIDRVSFTVAEGESFGLVGESGCGKSTVARCIVGLVTPDEGRIVVDGEAIAARKGERGRRLHRSVQMVFQDPFSSLNPRLVIGTTLAEPLAIAGGLSRAQIRARVGELLGEVGLPADAAAKFPHEFSGGQRQRISIARALALKPPLIVADEPVSALDVSVQAQILLLLDGLRTSRNLGLLFISHDLAVVRNFCQRVAVMYLGRIVEEGPVERVFARPMHPYTLALRDSSLPPDPAARDRLARIEGEMPSAIDPPTGCHFHPRCPRRMPICAVEAPAWTALDPGGVACHLHPPTPVSPATNRGI